MHFRVHTDTRNVANVTFKGMKNTKHHFSGVIGYMRHLDHLWFTFRGFHKKHFFLIFLRNRLAVHAAAKNVVILIVHGAKYKIHHISGVLGHNKTFGYS